MSKLLLPPTPTPSWISKIISETPLPQNFTEYAGDDVGEPPLPRSTLIFYLPPIFYD